MHRVEPALKLQGLVVRIGQDGTRHRYERSVDVAHVFDVPLCLAKHLRYRVFNHFVVQRDNLSGYIVFLVFRILQEDAAHYYFELVAVLLADNVLVVGFSENSVSEPVLYYLDIIRREECTRESGVVPVADEGVEVGTALVDRDFIGE